MTAEETILQYRNVAVVGLSSDPQRPSYRVAAYLAEHGYNIIPVNPTLPQVLGRPSYPDLASVPEKIEVVDIFRKAEDVMPIVAEAIKIGAKAVWMQEGGVDAGRHRERGRRRPRQGRRTAGGHGPLHAQGARASQPEKGVVR